MKDTTPKVKGPASFADGEKRPTRRRTTPRLATIFEDYTTQKPDNAWGHFMLGLSTWKAGDLDKSQKAFETALTIDPNHLKSLLNLSRVLIEKKQDHDAIDTLDASWRRRAQFDGRVSAARPRVSRPGQDGRCRRCVYPRDQLDDKDAWSMNNLGLVLLEKRRADEALPFLAKAVELKKDVAVFHNNLGMALEHTGRFGAAATAYGNAVTADPAIDKAKQNLARVEAVKKGPEEPFDAESTAKGVTKETTEQTASK